MQSAGGAVLVLGELWSVKRKISSSTGDGGEEQCTAVQVQDQLGIFANQAPKQDNTQNIKIEN